MPADCYGSLGPFSIGDCSNKQDIQKTKNTIIQNSSRSVQQSMTSNESTTVNLQQQKVNLINKRPGCCDPFVVSQQANIKMINTNKDTSNMATNMMQSVISDMQTQMNASQSAESDIGATPTGQSLKMAINDALTQISTSEDIKNAVKENMSETFNLQSQEINIVCGDYTMPPPPKGQVTGKDNTTGQTVTTELPDTGCYLTQDFLFEQVANNTFETIMSSVLENENVAKAMDAVVTEQKSKAKGIGSIISSIFGAYTMIVIAVIIGAIIFIPLIMWAFKIDTPKRSGMFTRAARSTSSGALQQIMQRLRQNIRR